MKIHNYPFYMLLVFFLTLVLVPSCVKETSIPTQTPSPLITKQYPPTLNKLQTKTITPGNNSSTRIQPMTPYPTDYPFPKMTIIEALNQTRVVALLSPTPPPGGALIGMGPTPDPIQLGLPPGTPMGDGILTDGAGMHMYQYMGSFFGNLLVWVTETEDGKAILVYAGVDADDQEQGLLYVVREGTIWAGIGKEIVIPTRSGKPTIIDAIGRRLIIETEDGDTFYFDVPSGRIAPSMDATLSTMTPGPTLTPRTTFTPLSGDDVADNLSWAAGWDLNTDIQYFIDPVGDGDWFRFYLASETTITVSLRNLPAEYGLWVLYSDDFEEIGKDMEFSKEDKIISIQNAEPGYYWVKVYGLNNSHNSEYPYILRVATE